MTPTVFYAWQSDLPEKGNRYFLRESLASTLKDLKISEPLRPETAATGVSGTPDIAATIFDKISQSEASLFDVSPIARGGRAGKALPNPNVMIELGYAAHAIGWERIILVMNKGYGHKPEELPFDLRSRRFPICYSHTGPDSPSHEIAEEIEGHLARAVAACLSSLHKQVDRVFARMNHHCLGLVHNFHTQESFAFQDGVLPPGLDRLLDLDVLWCHSVLEQKTYGYHWTHLGKRLCQAYAERQAEQNNRLPTTRATCVALPSAPSSRPNT